MAAMLVPGVQPLEQAGPWSGHVLAALAALLVGGLTMACFLLVRSGRHARQAARTIQERYARQMDDLLHQQELRMREAVERGAARERERTDTDMKERLNVVMRTLRDGCDHLEERLAAVEAHEQQRITDIRSRLDEAMFELRRAGKATVRIMLDRFGLQDLLEDLRWSLEATGLMRVGLSLEGIALPLDRRYQVGIYHLVNDAVDAALGYRGVSRLDIRLERRGGGCVLSVESDGGDPISGHPLGEEGRRRLEDRAASLNGSVSSGPLPHGGHAVLVDIPLNT